MKITLDIPIKPGQTVYVVQNGRIRSGRVKMISAFDGGNGDWKVAVHVLGSGIRRPEDVYLTEEEALEVKNHELEI